MRVQPRHIGVGIVALLTLAWPLLVYFGIGRVDPRWLALLLVALAVVRALAGRDRLWWCASAAAMVLALLTMLGNSVLPLKLYPFIVNAMLLLVFASSLRFGPPVIERLARLREPDLPSSGVRYTRRVTVLWCGFFVVNGSIALATALLGSDAAWALYNGLIAYLLMGALFIAEWLVRQRVRALPR